MSDKKVYNLAIEKIIKNKAETFENLAKIKRSISAKFGIPNIKNTDLLKVYHSLIKAGKIKKSENVEKLLRIRSVRSLSGVAAVSVLTKPYPCPGNCLYCPTQDGMPKSYLDNEPAVMRAVLNNFDPSKQVKTRLNSLKLTGHSTDKIELIIIGGTWSFLPKDYQGKFIKECFDACNGKKSKTLELAQNLNEKTKHRIIGITIETRPDYISEKEILRLRKLGVTRVEIGVQSIFDDVLKFNNRGCNIQAVVKATRLLKDAGFKICYHMMPNLPKSTPAKDIKMFKELFANPDFQPDFLKIYPCVVVKEAPLYKLWKQGKFKVYSDKQLVEILKSVKKEVPVYCRIIRVIRDIPSLRISAGSKISNLRETVMAELKREGSDCKCIRCREVKADYNLNVKLKLFREDYNASGGKEIFLSFEDAKRKHLYSLLRLRIPSQAKLIPVLENSAIIREVHTYGKSVPIEENTKISPQHKGLGEKLIREAEKISKNEFKLSRVSIIAGVGTRNYYRKFGYELKDTYMVKNI